MSLSAYRSGSTLGAYALITPTARDLFLGAFGAAVAAVEPERATFEMLGSSRVAGSPWLHDGDVTIIAIGKAACAMARGAAHACNVVGGIAVSDRMDPCPVPVLVGDHPVPGSGSFDAGNAVVATLNRLDPQTPVLFLISGGGSALAEVPRTSIDRADVAKMNQVLMASGLAIADMNEIRASVSAIKGGRLAEHVSGPKLTLVLSDVVDGGPHHVASGPSIPSSLGTRAGHIIQQAELAHRLPRRIVAEASLGRLADVAAESPVLIIGSPDVAARAAVSHLEAGGFDATVASSSLSGDLVRAVDRVVSEASVDRVDVYAGEVSIEVAGAGLGGRNQHAALFAALLIEGTDLVFAALGTDGRDGPTDAAGAIVDGRTASRIRSNGMDAASALVDFDSHGVLGASGDLVHTGRTGTNVADIWFVGRFG